MGIVVVVGLRDYVLQYRFKYARSTLALESP